MTEDGSQVDVAVENDVIIATLLDKKILDELSISRISGKLNELAGSQVKPQMVLDFANVGHMSSSALGMIITLHKRIRERGGRLQLCNIQPAIFEVFVITRLNEIFSIFSSRQEAIASLG